MGAGDKMSNKAREMTGRAKEAVGRGTADRSLEVEGKADQSRARGRQAVEHAKDTFRDIGEALMPGRRRRARRAARRADRRAARRDAVTRDPVTRGGVTRDPASRAW
jgi:uncharacterized protein YjbJ (UPF0337 family)